MINNHKLDLKNKLFLSSNPESTDQHSPYTAKVFTPSRCSIQTNNVGEITAKTYQMDLLESPEELKINSMMSRTLEMKKRSIRRASLLSNSPDPRLQKLASKLSRCSQKVFLLKDGSKTVWRCRSRFCHVCQDLKRNELKRNFIDNLISREYQPDQYILLTLTTGDHPEDQIKSKIKEMNSAWSKLTRRKAWKESIEGAIKVIEHIPSEQGLINLHLHALLAVNENFRTSPLFWYEYDKASHLQRIPKLSAIWSRYLKTQNLIVHRKTIRRHQELTQFEIDCGFSQDKIGPSELGNTALNYLLKFETNSKDTFDSLGAKLDEDSKESKIVKQLKHSKLITSSGSLKGILRRKKIELAQDAIDQIEESHNEKLRSENILAKFELPACTFRYKLVLGFTPHDLEFAKLKRHSRTLLNQINYPPTLDPIARITNAVSISPPNITSPAERALIDMLKDDEE